MDWQKLTDRIARPKLVGRTIVNNTDVSTVLLPWSPFGESDRDVWETCLFLDNGDSKVVDHYYSEHDAILGHAEWVNRMVDGTKI